VQRAMGQYVESFRDLDVYKAARQLVGAQIAEAWGKRNYINHFVSKLTDSDGEQLETQHWLGIALDCEYITDSESNTFIMKCQSIGRMLGSMINNPDSFCKK